MTATRTLSGAAGIAGIGHTEYSRRSGRSELQLAVEAIQHALADAGLTPADVDGIVKFRDDSSSEWDLQRALGIPRLRYHAQISYGGQSGPACVGQATAAIAGGLARVVVAFRALN
jgi:acetyl-CoA acetyltransferase